MISCFTKEQWQRPLAEYNLICVSHKAVEQYFHKRSHNFTKKTFFRMKTKVRTLKNIWRTCKEVYHWHHVFWILSGHVSKTAQDCFVLRTFSCFIHLVVSRVKRRNTSTALYFYTCTHPFLYKFCLLYFWRWYYNKNFRSIFVSFL